MEEGITINSDAMFNNYQRDFINSLIHQITIPESEKNIKTFEIDIFNVNEKQLYLGLQKINRFGYQYPKIPSKMLDKYFWNYIDIVKISFPNSNQFHLLPKDSLDKDYYSRIGNLFNPVTIHCYFTFKFNECLMLEKIFS